ncbi:hypothetical protein LCGC14_1986910, partial [marine sediment metagenome]
MEAKAKKEKELALNGGKPAKTTPNLPMFPGGMEIGEEEKKAVLEVLDHKYLFRYYGPEEFPSRVKMLEEEFAQRIGIKHALAVNSCTSALITSLIAVGVGPGLGCKPNSGKALKELIETVSVPMVIDA